jgi:septation ring formation regulator EzrA
MDGKSITDLLALMAEQLQRMDQLFDRMEVQEKGLKAMSEKYDKLFESQARIYERQFERLDIAYQILISHSKTFDALHGETKELSQDLESFREQTKELHIKYDAAKVEIDRLKVEVSDIQKEIIEQYAKNDAEMLALSERIKSNERPKQ